MQVQQQTNSNGLPPALRVLPDMQSRWHDVDQDFDTAADHLVAAHRADGDARDLPVMDLRLYGLAGQTGSFALRPIAGHEPPRPLRSAAFSALCARLGAPVEFVRDRLPAPLQLAVMNLLMSQGDRAASATLRLRGDQVSALVSERYAPLDPVELVETLREVLVQQGLVRDVRVRALATGLTDVLRLVMPSTETAIQVGDVSALGLDISSSSFGRSAVHVRAVVWRLVCSNGLRASENVGRASFRHVGDPARLRDGLRDAVPAVLAHGTGLFSQWRRAVTSYVENIESVMESFRDMTQVERTKATDAIKSEAGTRELPERLDVYRLVNGLTQAAHDAEPARRLELETMAGDFLRRSVQ